MASAIILTSGTEKRFFWNVDAKVGINCPNRRDDLDLVQLGYFFFAKNSQITPAERAVYSKVVVGAGCTGKQDDPLIRAIVTHQAIRGGTQDGHVSVIVPGGGSYADRTGKHTFMLVALNNNIIDGSAGMFPRLDKLSNCPESLKKLARFTLEGAT